MKLLLILFINIMSWVVQASSDGVTMSLATQFNDKIDRAAKLADKSLSCKKDEECISIPVGMGCGSPRMRLVTSITSENLSEIISLAKDVTEIDNLILQIGFCSVPPVPTLNCRENICRTSFSTSKGIQYNTVNNAKDIQWLKYVLE